MRILYITNGFPYPLTTGYLRHYFLIRELARRHAVTLLSLARYGFAAEHIEPMRPLTERIMVFADEVRGRLPMHKSLRNLLALWGRDSAVRALCAAVKRLTSEERFDAALLSGKQTFPAMQALGDLPVVVDLCDAASFRIRGTMRYAGWRRMPQLAVQYLQLRRVEKRLIRDAAHLVFASRRDQELLLRGSGRRGTVVPNGVDLDYWRRSSQVRGENTIVFTGGMNYPPNTDAAMHLIEEVFPLVQRSVPDARLLIVGRDPTRELIAAGRWAGVSVTGFVDDVRPYLERATVFAAPLRFGAGIQNKLLEAMAMGVPVVASTLAADGVRIGPDTVPPIEVADDRRQFAELLTRRLTSWRGDPAADAEARCFVARHFVWQRQGNALEQIICAAAAATATAATAGGS